VADRLLGESDRKSSLSVVYAMAVAARTGYTTNAPTPDRDSVDMRISAGGDMRPSLDLQIKATSTLKWSEGKASYSISRKNYDDLRCSRITPIVLVVLEVPRDEERWMEFGSEHLLVRRCAWWLSLSGEPEIDTDTKTVHMTENQRFSPDSLRELMKWARSGQP